MINNELQVRLLHAAKDRTGWKQVSNRPKLGEVCLESFEDPNNNLGHVFKIKIGDNSRKFCRYIGSSTATPPPLTPEEDWDFTSEDVLPYFGTVVTASGNAQVVEFYTYPNSYADVSLQNVTVMRIYELSLSYSSGSGSGETAVNLSVDTTTFKEIRPGSNISFTSSNSGALLTIAANMDFSSLDVTEYAQVEWDNNNKQIKIYGIKEVDGKISRGASFKSLKVSSPLTISNTDNIITFGIQNATTQQKGAVRLLDTYESINASDNTFATTNAAITAAIASLNGTATTSNTEDSKDVIVTVTESNGIVSSTKKTITEGDKITISTPTTGADAGKMIISHEESNTVVTDNSSNKNERETNIITDVTVDDYGHVTAYTKDKSTNLIAADIRASVTNTDDTTWNYRETGGEISIGEDIARVSKLKGNTIVWNQNVENGDFSNGDSGWSGITGVSSGIATKIVTSTGSSISGPIIQTKQYTINHKYLFIATVKSNNSATRISLAPTGTSSDGSREYTYYGDWTTIRYIWTGVEREGSKLIIRGNNSLDPNTDVNFSIKNVMCLDLTKMFGSDNNICTSLGVADLIDNQGNLTIDTTKLNTAIANFEKLFPNPYYYYNAGELVSLGGYSASFNVWDEEWEQGGFNTSGGEVSGTSKIRSKNYIPIVKNGTYYFLVPESRIVFFDAALNVLGTRYMSSSGTINTQTFPGSAYIRFGTTDAYGGTYNNDICVNISNAALNGLYLPYGEPLPFGVKSTGFNQWDEIGEIGNITSTTGEDTSSTSGTNWRSVNYIPVIPGATYYCKSDVSIFSRMYDSNKEFVPEGNLNIKNSTFDIPLNVYYLRFVTGALPQQPICINISDTKRNGTYEPYKTDTLDLDWVRNEGVENFNIWDEEWELGVLNSSTGQVNYSTISIVSKNFIPVLPNTAYYIKSPTTDFNRMTYYDINKQYLGSTAGGWDNFNEGIHTTPNNAYYCRFCVRTVTYNNDICINLSNPALNGEYHPHGAKAKYFPYGLLSAGSVYDEVGENYAIKRVGAVDLGELTWDNLDSNLRFRTENLNGIIKYGNRIAQVLCIKYQAIENGEAYNPEWDKVIYSVNGFVYATDSSFPSSATGDEFKAAMSGVMLYYELATPVVVYFDKKKKLTYFVDDHGTEQQLPVNGSSVITSPFVGTFEYKSNFKDAVIDLINKANAYKNPVKSKDNVSQTVGKFATYDSAETVKSSEYYTDLTATLSDTDTYRLPTVPQLIQYVTESQANALAYKGTVSSYDGNNSVTSKVTSDIQSGWLYFIDTQFTLDSAETYLPAGTYNIGDFIVWNAANNKFDVIKGVHNINNPNTTLAFGSSAVTSQTIATVDGIPITVGMPVLDIASSTSGNTNTFIDSITYANNTVSVTKKSIPDASSTTEGLVDIINVESATSTTPDNSVSSAYDLLQALNHRDVGVGSLSTISTYSYGTLHKRTLSNNAWTNSDFYPITKFDVIAQSESILGGGGNTGYLKRKSSGSSYVWELDPYGGGGVMPYKSNSNGTGDVATSSKTTAQINSLPTSSEKVLARTALREQVGTDNYVYHKISVGALENDSNIVLVLNGNFS